MKQTPAHELHNEDLLSMIPVNANRVIEIGCSTGAMAREFKKKSPRTYWLGVEINESYARRASYFCDETVTLNIEDCNSEFFESQKDKDVWVFGDVLEHLKDPWKVIENVRRVIPDNGSVLACIPNAQHWSFILKMISGDFFYEDIGLLDRTHLRWFTRKTMLDLFRSRGFRIVEGRPRVFGMPDPQFLEFLRSIAKKYGWNEEEVLNDSVPLQHILHAVPS